MVGQRGERHIVRLRAVTKVYPPSSVALSDVSLELERGEFLFLIGPSGAGKSTLIRLLYREERATSGTIFVNGHDLMRMRGRQVPYLRRQIGVVFQDFKLLPRKTVAQNIAFPLVVSEHSPREIRRRVGLMLEMFGLRDRADALPAELSGGEQQRTAIARAVVGNPALLICDEPTGNLDPATAAGISQLLEEINRRGTTLIVATHSEQMVNTLRRRVVVIEGGRVVRDEASGAYHAPGREAEAVAAVGGAGVPARVPAWGLRSQRGGTGPARHRH
jgi:cell division transport system ATP-binding protein